jgi:hypothetical protein
MFLQGKAESIEIGMIQAREVVVNPEDNGKPTLGKIRSRPFLMWQWSLCISSSIVSMSYWTCRRSCRNSEEEVAERSHVPPVLAGLPRLGQASDG